MAEAAREELDTEGGAVVDRAVLADRRARRAEAAEQAQARIAREAVQAVHTLERRVAELESQLEQARSAARPPEPPAVDVVAGRRIEWLRSALSSAIVTIGDLRLQLESERSLRADLEQALERATAADARPASPPDPAVMAELARTLRPPKPEPRRAEKLVADLDAAAAALREESEPAKPEPQIVSPAGEPPTRVHTARGTRAYPPLRGALVKLAHDDARAAAHLLAGLLPAQWRALEQPVDYDLTIVELGIHAVTVTAGAVSVAPLERPRRQAQFHLRADALTLAEMLAGVGPRPWRFGRARLKGGRRRFKALDPLRTTTMTLEDALRAGATLDPVLALRCLAYTLHPSWTRGHDFTVAHTLTGPDRTLHLIVADGRGLTVSEQPPAGRPDATVEITRPAFAALLCGDKPAERPVVRGDHRAVDQLRDWADRVRRGEL